MKIRILRNSLTNNGAINIERYVGQIFEVEMHGKYGRIGINIEGIGTIMIYPDEYEIVEVGGELVNILQ